MRSFDEDGRVVSESHAYGMLDIGITMEFTAGAKTGEMYFVNKKLASRRLVLSMPTCHSQTRNSKISVANY